MQFSFTIYNKSKIETMTNSINDTKKLNIIQSNVFKCEIMQLVNLN